MLSTILRVAHKQRLICERPRFDLLKVDKLPPRYFSDDEIRQIIAQSRPLVRDITLVLLHTGLRVGELRCLKWTDIDFKERQLMVRIAKSHKFRVIGINTTLIAELQRLKENSHPKQQFVFEKPDGTPYASYSNIFQSQLRKLGMKGNVHRLRHTFASRLVQQGVSIYTVKELLGHSSVQTTQIYAHLNKEELKKAVCELDKVWEGMV